MARSNYTEREWNIILSWPMDERQRFYEDIKQHVGAPECLLREYKIRALNYPDDGLPINFIPVGGWRMDENHQYHMFDISLGFGPGDESRKEKAQYRKKKRREKMRKYENQINSRRQRESRRDRLNYSLEVDATHYHFYPRALYYDGQWSDSVTTT